ncbi:MAG: NADP-dependent malic enzyme [Candidatus Bathyarchaeota archaeon]|nr:MAG: NADP-dependent malic enzyme [Candidatus Bathyarchaeota archaeon]
MPKCPIRTPADFAIWYTPGVAASCRKIKDDPEQVFSQTNRWNYVAVVSDGTRVLGLGDIGPQAGLPVMEGKALLFKYLGGVDAFPICLGTRNPEEIITACEWLEPTFGGINLEDISKPKCFHILEETRKRLSIPVWHDDQQGTATVTLAGVINALKIVGKKMSQAKMAIIGVGAANTRAAIVLERAGVKPGNLILVDSKGILHPGRKDIEAQKRENPWKWDFCLNTNAEGKTGSISDSLEGADICIAASKPSPNVIKKTDVAKMATDAIVFACANPIPEIWPWDAKEAGARITATGRSDFENQINNSLGFPAIFRGVLDVRATTITDDMCIAAGRELAAFAEERGIHEGDIVPRMEEWEVFPREAVACALQSIKEGVARVKLSRQELWDRAVSIIKNAMDSTALLMKNGLIPSPPPEEEILRNP